MIVLNGPLGMTRYFTILVEFQVRVVHTFKNVSSTSTLKDMQKISR